MDKTRKRSSQCFFLLNSVYLYLQATGELVSVPAPMEPDSDSDFNPGVYVYETKAKVKRSNGRKRRKLASDSESEPSYKPKYTPRPTASQNVLLQYLGRDLDLSSDDDGQVADDENGPAMEEEDDVDPADSVVPSSEADYSPKLSRTFTILQKPPPLPVPIVDLAASSHTEDDSVTEPDSGDEGPPLPDISTYRKPDPEASVTESDSGDDEALSKLEPVPSIVPPAIKPSIEEDTKPDEPPKNLSPRPNFPIPDGQSALGPLILDEELGVKVPPSINTFLREYQRDGIRFFYDRYKEDRGGLLGDDIATADADGATFPGSKMWGYFEVGMFHGTPAEQEVALHDFELGRLDVVLTSFDLARRHIDKLDTLPWSCVIVDEAHRLKSITSKLTQAFHQFVCPGRIGLTGTAIQNSDAEAVEGPGGEATGGGPIVGFERGAAGKRAALILRDKILPNFFLRRTKEIIKHQLPKKIDEVVFCPLTEVQIDVYKRLLAMEPVQNLIRKDEMCPCGSQEKRKDCCFPFAAGDLFKFMSVLIKLANHLALILPGPDDTPDQLARNRELVAIAFPKKNAPKHVTAMLQEKYCGKWRALEMLLTDWRKDRTNKVLIFTKSVKLLTMLEFHLNNRGFGYVKLEGKTHSKDPANKVVVFDPNWNPAHDLQAMDRAYRFGQTRDVHVYRLLGAGSIEELIYARQIYKQQQMAIGYQASVQTRFFEGIQGDTTKQGELFGIKNIFKLHEHTLSTKTVIERASIAEFDWAMANLTGSNSGKKSKARDELTADAGQDAGDLRGLGALLFDEHVPDVSNEETAIQKTLSTVGVYSHKNDEILASSKIEEARVLNALKESKRRKRARKSAAKGEPEKAPEPVWPPKRKHHKPKPTPQELITLRQEALLELQYIERPDQLPDFALEFARTSIEDQNALVAKLDRHREKKARTHQ
ncbi:hypothetical protein CCMSSC00406_0003545 [Pleurotus cornucopiae]|uniref:Uncharacterized protein n=1 Tax=Pleurotus cornucopiae TaxID=5321 RepID=A0ACB7IIS0_PLECO|nr:hypothetical protein CCMSSC00406_0003545 [Pleurotus cornucopiae]